MEISIKCSNCGNPYPEAGAPYRCTKCGGIYQIKLMPQFFIENAGRSEGIWSSLNPDCLNAKDHLITLGEGNTPLIQEQIEVKNQAWDVYYKCEFINPTGSFKDRGSAAIITFLKERGIENIFEDSSGNAGASIAAYAARAGMRANVYVPAQASGVKKEQIKQYGANMILVEGPRSKVSEVLLRDLSKDNSGYSAYASHAHMPFNLYGYATIAFEIFKQLGKSPGTIMTPLGQGGCLLGVYYGFKSLLENGFIDRIPTFIGVQARACAPLWATFEYGVSGLQWVSEGNTIAEGIRIKYPVRGDEVLQAIQMSNGKIFAVDEEEIINAGVHLAHKGLLVEPTSAVVEAALIQHIDEFNPPIVAILTGSGLKTMEVYGRSANPK